MGKVGGGNLRLAVTQNLAITLGIYPNSTNLRLCHIRGKNTRHIKYNIHKGHNTYTIILIEAIPSKYNMIFLYKAFVKHLVRMKKQGNGCSNPQAEGQKITISIRQCSVCIRNCGVTKSMVNQQANVHIHICGHNMCVGINIKREVEATHANQEKISVQKMNRQ